MKQTLLIVALTLLMFIDCSKGDSKSGSCSLSMASIAGTYMLTGATSQQNASSPVIDEFSTYTACSKDDKYTFNADGTAVVDDAAIRCNPTTAGTSHWSLNGTTLIADSDTFTVKSFDCKTLVLVTSYSPGEIDTKYLTKQ